MKAGFEAQVARLKEDNDRQQADHTKSSRMLSEVSSLKSQNESLLSSLDSSSLETSEPPTPKPSPFKLQPQKSHRKQKRRR